MSNKYGKWARTYHASHPLFIYVVSSLPSDQSDFVTRDRKLAGDAFDCLASDPDRRWCRSSIMGKPYQLSVSQGRSEWTPVPIVPSH